MRARRAEGRRKRWTARGAGECFAHEKIVKMWNISGILEIHENMTSEHVWGLGNSLGACAARNVKNYMWLVEIALQNLSNTILQPARICENDGR